ncbi:MAG: hypothetical protein Tsb0014_19250 [Pleurocapsa sp.]
MKQLLIIAGPSGSGKTTLINQIKQSKSSIYHQLEIDTSTIFEDIIFREIESKKLNLSDSTILHYDFFEQFIQNQNFHLLADLVKGFDRVVLITLLTSSNILKKRIQARLIKTIGLMLLKPSKFLGKVKFYKNQYPKYQAYKDNQNLSNLYDTWFEFCQFLDVDNHWLVETNNQSEYDFTLLPRQN